MKISKLIYGAIAVGVVANLALGATAATAATTYSSTLMTGTTLSDDVTTPPAFFNGKVITLTNASEALYATDPSTGSTVDLLSSVNSSGDRYYVSYAYGLVKYFTNTQFNGKAWLFVFDDLESNYDLLYTDGTVAGTGVVELDLDERWDVEIAANADGVYFWNQDNLGHQDLYWFNGTTVTELNVTDVSTDSYPYAIRNFQGKISFLVANYDDGETIQGYVSSNASWSEVGVIPNMDPTTNSWDYDYLYFDGQDASNAYVALDDNNNEYSLWRTSAYNTLYTVLVDNDLNHSDGVFFNGKYYFSGLSTDPSQPNGYPTLARTNGTTAEAVHGGDLSYPGGFTVAGNKLYFAAYDEGDNTWSVYSLDTSDNLDMVAEDWSYDGYDWAVGAGANGAFFFQACDDAHGCELWVDDAEGTRLAADLTVGTDSSYPYYFSTNGDLVCFGATVVGDGSVVDQDDLYCVETEMLASTGVDANGIGAAAALLLIAGAGTAIVARRRARA